MGAVYRAFPRTVCALNRGGETYREFISLVQTTESVNEITDKFLERSLFCPEFIANERMKMYRYAEVLKPEIREFVVMARCTDFHLMHDMARARELELERQGKKRK